MEATVTPLHHADQAVLTLRQIDRLNGVAKGAAFRAFKRARPALVEGRDFFVLDPEQDAERIGALKHAALAYDSSRSVVLLTAAAYQAMQRTVAD